VYVALHLLWRFSVLCTAVPLGSSVAPGSSTISSHASLWDEGVDTHAGNRRFRARFFGFRAGTLRHGLSTPAVRRKWKPISELIPALLIVAIVLLLVRSRGSPVSSLERDWHGVARSGAPDTSACGCVALNRTGSESGRASWELSVRLKRRGMARLGWPTTARDLDQLDSRKAFSWLFASELRLLRESAAVAHFKRP
jgi:hypothetical protein